MVTPPSYKYFYPRSPCGERPCTAETDITLIGFLSTLSLRRATVTPMLTPPSYKYFYPRSPCGERHVFFCHEVQAYAYFYPRSPCGERRLCSVQPSAVVVFLSTLSLRRATPVILFRVKSASISIHALLAESDTVNIQRPSAKNDFYPRSPCGERPIKFKLDFINQEFLSTLSLRRATKKKIIQPDKSHISIHALLAESDTI